jgi:hypothetical protein
MPEDAAREVGESVVESDKSLFVLRDVLVKMQSGVVDFYQAPRRVVFMPCPREPSRS